MPPVVRQTFENWFFSRKPADPAAAIHPSRGPIVLFHDTFTNFNHPPVGVAATRLLKALGYDVMVLPQRRCCGRPMVSKGLLDRAAVELAASDARGEGPIAEPSPGVVSPMPWGPTIAAGAFPNTRLHSRDESLNKANPPAAGTNVAISRNLFQVTPSTK